MAFAGPNLEDDFLKYKEDAIDKELDLDSRKDKIMLDGA